VGSERFTENLTLVSRDTGTWRTLKGRKEKGRKGRRKKYQKIKNKTVNGKTRKKKKKRKLREEEYSRQVNPMRLYQVTEAIICSSSVKHSWHVHAAIKCMNPPISLLWIALYL
jgi:G:T/U-mismatch repair DNA glycosylase